MDIRQPILLFVIISLAFSSSVLCAQAPKQDTHTYKVAVLPFATDKPELESLAMKMRSRLSQHLEKIASFQLIAYRAIAETLSTHDITATNCGTPACGLQAGKALSVDLVINGKIEDLGTRLNVTIQMLHVRTSTIVMSRTRTLNKDFRSINEFIDHTALEFLGRQAPAQSKTNSKQTNPDLNSHTLNWPLTVTAAVGALAAFIILNQTTF